MTPYKERLEAREKTLGASHMPGCMGSAGFQQAGEVLNFGGLRVVGSEGSSGFSVEKLQTEIQETEGVALEWDN